MRAAHGMQERMGLSTVHCGQAGVTIMLLTVIHATCGVTPALPVLVPHVHAVPCGLPLAGKPQCWSRDMVCYGPWPGCEEDAAGA
jgi:hypothetical protein